MPHETVKANLAETFRKIEKPKKDHLGGKNHARETSNPLKGKKQMHLQVCDLTIAIIHL